jgi:putative ABC transport system permease protein
MKFLFLIWDNVCRNVTRTLLTSLGTMMLVVVVTGVWSILEFLNDVTSEKTSNIKAIVTERWRIPSQMPYAYSAMMKDGAAREPGDIKPDDYMSWTFYGAGTDPDPKKRTMDNTLFAFCMEPEKLLTMMDELDSLKGKELADFTALVESLKTNQQGIIIGKAKLKQLNKQIGDRMTVYSFNYKDINLEVEIIGTFPGKRYDQSSVINIEYFNRALFDAYPLTHQGQKHPAADKSLNLVWLRMPNTPAFNKVADQVMNSPSFASPAVKVETASSGIASFLEAYRDIFWAARVLLAPSIIITLSVVIANSISISVRERRMEFAIMKVLGYRPWQILLLVIGEALLIGGLSGLVSAGGAYYLVNNVFGGIPFPIAFFPAFNISKMAPVWGLFIGLGAALFGSLLPAIDACRVRVAEVFGRVG